MIRIVVGRLYLGPLVLGMLRILGSCVGLCNAL